MNEPVRDREMSSKKNWYAVYTKPRWEKKVARIFLQRGLEGYCPVHKVRRKWSDRMKTVEEPLFKSYVFVRTTDEEKSLVRMVNGVVNFVYWLGKPAIVKDKEIEIIRKFLNEYEQVVAEPLVLEPGKEAKIAHGLFMDKPAKILRVINNRVQVVIENIGYTLIATVEKSNLSVIEK